MAHEVIMKEFHIPDYILIPDSKVQNETPIPSCPVVVFINSRSGGQLGGDLLRTYRKLLNEAQVFDLGEEAPDKVLHRLYANLEKLKSCGDACATKIRESLRLIVAGGDGTASWLLGVVSDLKLDRPPPVATVPLGTGNNLPFSFGWGKKNPGTDDHSVKAFLTLVKEARKMEIDSWHIIMTMKTPKDGTCDPIAPLELPHSLHAFQRVSNKNSPTMEGYDTFRGGFWNYFSMGMDAEVSYAFHSERKKHPEKFKNQFTNQTTYAKIGFGTLAHPSPGIAQLAEVKISKGQDKWEVLHIDPSIRSIVCLNLPSFSGGFNPWGTPSRWRNDNWTPPFVDDGFIEVVGFKDAWHGLVLLTPRGHGIRLAQAHGIQFKFHKGAAAHTYMRIDGEPWKQPLPVDDDTVVVKISHHGQVSMLASGNCRSKGVQESSSPSSHQSGSGDNLDEDEESREEERRKFGAAETFKIDQEIDIAHLS